MGSKTPSVEQGAPPARRGTVRHRLIPRHLPFHMGFAGLQFRKDLFRQPDRHLRRRLVYRRYHAWMHVLFVGFIFFVRNHSYKCTSPPSPTSCQEAHDLHVKLVHHEDVTGTLADHGLHFSSRVPRIWMTMLTNPLALTPNLIGVHNFTAGLPYTFIFLRARNSTA